MNTITEMLKQPFDPKIIHWRVGATNAKKLGCKPWEATQGIALAYVDARDVMKRLDDVCGDLWQSRAPYKGYCEIALKIDGEWLWRGNSAGETEVEGEKGQASDAFKRAAVLWGVGRYLYYLPNKWVALEDGKIKTPPELPAWAKPSVFRWKAGEKDRIYGEAMEALTNGHEDKLKELLADYSSPEEQMAFWSIFTSRERSSYKDMIKDD